MYFESIVVSENDARLKAKTTTTHELIPYLLTLKNMTAVMIIKKDGEQFDYEDVCNYFK